MNNDTRKLLVECMTFDTNQEMLRESVSHPTQPFRVQGILQRKGKKNQNGRIYPDEVLIREASKYAQTFIAERRAMGECVPAGTEIFSKNGWKNIEDINIGDEVFTLNIGADLLELQSVTDTIQKPYNDAMIHIYNSKNLDMMVTKKHKVILWDRYDNPYVLTAEELYEKIKSNDSIVSHSYIKNSGKWTGIYKEYFTLLNTDIKINLDCRFLYAELVDFNDTVYCVTVPNSTWLMRYNGKVSWTHNCDHPESSVVNLRNVSHNVVEMHWQGDDLLGTIEILTTPNGNILRELFRNGIKLGISSRGLGTLKKISENSAIVGDDFELIAFDFVSNPSTQGAFMAPMGQTTLAEGIVKDPLTNKWARTDDIIRNILSELI